MYEWYNILFTILAAIGLLIICIGIFIYFYRMSIVDGLNKKSQNEFYKSMSDYLKYLKEKGKE